MAGLKIEGDLKEINNAQLLFIKSVIEKQGFKDNKVIIEPVGKAGDNYVANVKRIIVEDGKGESFKMVAKIAPQNEVLRQMANTDYIFRNEHIMYTKVLPKFAQLEEAADVPHQGRLRYAICYGSCDETPNEVIILEDLNESNFKMLDRFKSLSDDCVKSVLRSFALLHSLSYVLKYKEPEVFDEFKNSLFDMWSDIQSKEEALQYFRQIETGASQIVESDIHKKTVNGAVTRCLKDFSKISKYEKESKHAVIQQGDAWTNNIMFKFNEDTLQESIMIDYQLAKPANPAADLLYMIFNCTDYESRKEHFYDWIDHYHNELDKALSNHGLKANFVFPRDQLDADLKRYGKIIFGLTIVLAAALTMKSEEAGAMKAAMETADVNEMMKEADVGVRDPETIALFKTRIEGLVNSYHEFGLIKLPN